MGRDLGIQRTVDLAGGPATGAEAEAEAEAVTEAVTEAGAEPEFDTGAEVREVRAETMIGVPQDEAQLITEDLEPESSRAQAHFSADGEA